MVVIRQEADLNLEELRSQLTDRLALLVMGAGGSLMWLMLSAAGLPVALPWVGFPTTPLALLGTMGI